MKKPLLFLLVTVFCTAYSQNEVMGDHTLLHHSSAELIRIVGQPFEIKPFHEGKLYTYIVKYGFIGYMFRNDSLLRINYTSYFKTKAEAKRLYDSVIGDFQAEGFTIYSKRKDCVYLQLSNFGVAMCIGNYEKMFTVNENIYSLIEE